MASVDVLSLVEVAIVTDMGRSIDDVCGMEDVKAALKEHVISPLKTGTLTCPLRILLCGAPGTGKSYLVRSLAKDILPVPMYAFYCFDLISRWHGEAAQFRQNVFQHAANQENGAVMLLDELETICTPYHADLFELLIEDLAKLPPKVVVIFNSLRPWTIPANFLPVFNKILYTPLPDREARLSQIRSLLKDHLSPSENDLGILADIAEGLTASDITCFLQEAVQKTVRDLMEASYFVEKGTIRDTRVCLLRCYLKDTLSLNDEEYNILADIAEGLTKADICVFLREAEANPTREYIHAKYFVERDGKMTPCDADTEGCIKTTAFDLLDLPDAEDKVSCRPLSLSDIQECLSRARPTISEEEIGQFEEFLGQTAH